MEFIAEVTDLGAPEYNVTGIASIERISIGQVRITKYASRKGENFVTHHEIWDIQIWQQWQGEYARAMQIVSRAAPNGPDDGRRRERH